MKPERFTIHFPEAQLADLRRRLEATRWPDELGNQDWRYGSNGDYLRTLVDHWLHHYDWRAQEREMNRYAHYRASVAGQPIHFIHEPGKGPRPIPLILTHGWPWTFWDFQHLIGPLTDPVAHGGSADDAFDVIVPSLPGFALSTPLARTGIGFTQTADLWVELMCEVLGYARFAAHGSDFGLVVTEQLGHKYADRLIGLHVQGASPLNFFEGGAARPEDYAPEDAGRVARNAAFAASEVGYMALQTTKPQSLAFGLNDSPVGLCSWLVEKRRTWSDCAGDVERRFSKDDLLTSVMLYWLTQSYGSSARFYYESAHQPWRASHDRQPVVEAPSGVIVFEHDIIGMPRRWAERYFDLRRYTRSGKGGHFGAAEEPQLMIDELRTFFRPLR